MLKGFHSVSGPAWQVFLWPQGGGLLSLGAHASFRDGLFASGGERKRKVRDLRAPSLARILLWLQK